MIVWEVKSVGPIINADTSELDRLLAEGWEPIGGQRGPNHTSVTWFLRRERGTVTLGRPEADTHEEAPRPLGAPGATSGRPSAT